MLQWLLPSKGHQSWCEEDGSPFQKKTIAGLQKLEDGHGGTRISRGLKVLPHCSDEKKKRILISGRVFECALCSKFMNSNCTPISRKHPMTCALANITGTTQMFVEAHLKSREHRREQTCPVKCQAEILKDHWQSLPFQPTSRWPLEKRLK